MGAIAVEGLTKHYGPVRALDGVTLDVHPGEVFGFLGPNGAGKTTTVDMLLGLTQPDAGTIQVYGSTPTEAVRAGRVSAVMQTGGLLNDFNVAETVQAIAALHGRPDRVDVVLERTRLTGLAKRRVEACSGGEQQRVVLARALAQYLFDDDHAMVRIDMGEYMEKFSTSRLIGAPPGYVGYDEGGQLTEAVRRRPYSVVLLDEIEKAHPDVFNTLLQVLDDGRLTDGQGRTVSFTNTVLIMTSNVGSDRIVGEQVDERIREQIEEVLAATFKPEFLNRIDDTVIFHRLSKADIGRIVELQVNQLVGRVRERGIEIELTDDARTLLGNLGYDPTYGARPLKRVIQKQLVDKLALKLLDGEFAPGDRVLVDAEGGELTFTKAASVAPATAA